MYIRIKICCISTIKEARLAIKYGASALGLVSAMPGGPGIITEDQITEITRIIPPGVASFLLTSKQDVSAIIEQQWRCRANTLQLCDRMEKGTLSELREALPGISIVQVIHVTGEEAVEEAIRIAPNVDALLLDSGNPALAVKELGGTGRTHDWRISRKICESVSVPVYLAGGLNAENVAEAIDQVWPFGVDVCSGVRTDDKLDEEKLAAFIKAVHSFIDQD